MYGLLERGTLMAKSKSNSSLHNAKTAKKDEFYTQRTDIEKELKHYENHFKGKIVYCNCDDPRVSKFFHYFFDKFEDLELKKLIATCYKSQNMELFSQNDSEQAIYLEYNGGKNSEDVPDIKKIEVNHLKEDGDFRSDESIALLKQADIIVTNPPFSKFRAYIAQLIEYDKKFIIVGHQNAIGYKEIFPLLKDNKLWLGYGFKGGAAHFINKHYEDYAVAGNHKEGMIRVSGVVWFTNLDIKKRHEDLNLFKKYTPEEYPKYDNYDAINVDITKEIPKDYDGVMGVPITFMNKYNPEQFEILGLSQKVGYGLESNKFYDDYEETRQDGTKTGSSGKKTNGNPVMKGMSKKNNYFTKGDDVVHSLYARIFIRNKAL